jgi:type II secretory pathway pseudopilin PulG
MSLQIKPSPALSNEAGRMKGQPLACPKRRTAGGFTLAEIIVSLFIIVMVFGAVITAYISAAFRAQWSGYNLAAQSLAMQQLEMARAAKWDVMVNPVDDEVILLGTNNPTMVSWTSTNGGATWSGYSTNTLDLPVVGTNVVWATNYCTVSYITNSTSPLVVLHMVQVQTVWPFLWYNKTLFYTNTLVDYISPDY